MEQIQEFLDSNNLRFSEYHKQILATRVEERRERGWQVVGVILGIAIYWVFIAPMLHYLLNR